MSNLIVTCLIEKSKRTCKIKCCSYIRCCGCIHADISRERYKPVYVTQYHLKPEYLEEEEVCKSKK